MVVITSNSERRLPEAFLRRCVFHNIKFTRELVERAVAAWAEYDFPDLTEDVRGAAVARFLELRGERLRKKPATAELLVWLCALSVRGNVTLDELGKPGDPLDQLPCIEALVKDRGDREALEKTR